MDDKIDYVWSENGLGFVALCHGQCIGEITFVRVGLDKLIIDHTGISDDYVNRDVGMQLMRCVATVARAQHRKIITLCPLARAMCCRNPEFDDVRLICAQR